jgi:hypothetical protein
MSQLVQVCRVVCFLEKIIEDKNLFELLFLQRPITDFLLDACPLPQKPLRPILIFPEVFLGNLRVNTPQLFVQRDEVKDNLGGSSFVRKECRYCF